LYLYKEWGGNYLEAIIDFRGGGRGLKTRGGTSGGSCLKDLAWRPKGKMSCRAFAVGERGEKKLYIIRGWGWFYRKKEIEKAY